MLQDGPFLWHEQAARRDLITATSRVDAGFVSSDDGCWEILSLDATTELVVSAF